MTQERRESPRRRTLKGAQIVFNNRRSTLECSIRNLSNYGALLAVRSLIGVPSEFELRIDAELRPARVVWKGIGKLGIAWL